MQYKFKTFNVGAGDCITLLLKNNDKELHIMVDCGKYTKEINDFIRNEFHNHIDYLIVTHIDNDHINGFISMLSSFPNLSINHILYNCYQRTSAQLNDWDDKMIANVQRIYGHLPVVLDLLEGKINAGASRTLAELILQNESWKKAWERDYITSDISPIELGGDMGKLIFLSPTQRELDDLDSEYRKLFWKMLYKKKELDYDKEESIYEALMRIMDKEIFGKEMDLISSSGLCEDTLRKYADECLGSLTPANKASISFVWEHDNHRILFSGDAEPEMVFAKLNEVYSDLPKPILFDIIKIAHHGSAHSVTKSQVEIADSKLYFVTGGAKIRPSYQALSRIILSPVSDNISSREIRYNRENEVLINLGKEEELKEKFHYSIVSNKNEYEVSY